MPATTASTGAAGSNAGPQPVQSQTIFDVLDRLERLEVRMTYVEHNSVSWEHGRNAFPPRGEFNSLSGEVENLKAQVVLVLSEDEP